MSILQQLTSLPDTQLNQQIADFSKRYDGTNMLFTGTLKGIPFENSLFYVKIRYPHLRLTNITDEYFIDVREKFSLIPYLPKIGYYNYLGKCLFLAKKPQKQYKRSICSSIYRMYNPNKDTRLGVTDDLFSVTLETLNPSYVPLDSLTHPLLTNIAINRFFAITSYKNKNFLTYRCCAIAELDYTSMTIKPTHEIMRQEIVDFLKRTGVTKWKLQPI